MDLLANFGISRIPFTRELRAEDYFSMPFFEEARDSLLDAVKNRMSAALISPSGTGKTALLRLVKEGLPEARYRVRYIKVTSLSKRDMCRELAAACGAPTAGTYPALVRSLQQHWEDWGRTDGVRPVLLIDEAHEMRPDVLAMLRILTNFEMDSRLVLSVIIAEQKSLATMLDLDEMEAVARRLAHVATLRLLAREETVRYLEHRCAIVGAAPVPFGTEAVEVIFDLSRGNLRAIDCLALKSMQIAATQDRSTVSSGDVALARKQLCL